MNEMNKILYKDKNMINKFTCHNFRNIEAQDLDFEKINLLIGPNNSGKSNFIKALTFLSQMLTHGDEGSLKSAFLNAVSRNGWNHILNHDANPEEAIQLIWDIDLQGKPVQYKFSFGAGKNVSDTNITLEEMNSGKIEKDYTREYNFFSCHKTEIGKGAFSSATTKGQKNKRIPFMLNSQETIIRQFKDILLQDQRYYGNETIRVDIAQLLYELEKYFMGFRVYASSRFDTNKLREPTGIRSLDRQLSSAGLNFANVFNTYKAQNPLWKIQFEERMKELIPSLAMADCVIAYDKLIFKMVMNHHEFDLSDVSEGTLKCLLLNLLINAPEDTDNTLLAIDEPETNLHPAWQKVIGRWILRSDSHKQFFISTHSPDFLDVFTEEFKRENVAVFVFRGNQTIKKIKYPQIQAELGDWELGDLYRTNDPALGGWPW